MNKVIEILMRRDGLTRQEAITVIREFQEDAEEGMAKGEDPEELLMEQLGLEPDYLFDLIL